MITTHIIVIRKNVPGTKINKQVNKKYESIKLLDDVTKR